MERFDKEKAFDKIVEILQVKNPNAGVSDFIKAMSKAQCFINEIYLKGYKDGLEKNLSLTGKDN